jgi:hypothetical protein
MTLSKRILGEKRAIVLPLVVGALANVAVYILAVRPLGIKSAGAASRASAAAQSLKSAEEDLSAARALVSGKSRADQEISTFFGKVLPADQAAAVGLTYVPLPTLARKANVKLVSRRFEAEPPKKDARLRRLHIVAVLQCEYEGFLQFIYELESAKEFFIIDDVTLTQSDPGKPLTLTIEMSTYYPLSAHGN